MQFGVLRCLKLAEVMLQNAGLVLPDVGFPAANQGSDEEGWSLPPWWPLHSCVASPAGGLLSSCSLTQVSTLGPGWHQHTFAHKRRSLYVQDCVNIESIQYFLPLFFLLLHAVGTQATFYTSEYIWKSQICKTHRLACKKNLRFYYIKKCNLFQIKPLKQV